MSKSKTTFSIALTSDQMDWLAEVMQNELCVCKEAPDELKRVESYALCVLAALSNPLPVYELEQA